MAHKGYYFALVNADSTLVEGEFYLVHLVDFQDLLENLSQGRVPI
jgi:hypothetical protein